MITVQIMRLRKTADFVRREVRVSDSCRFCSLVVAVVAYGRLWPVGAARGARSHFRRRAIHRTECHFATITGRADRGVQERPAYRGKGRRAL